MAGYNEPGVGYSEAGFAYDGVEPTPGGTTATEENYTRSWIMKRVSWTLDGYPVDMQGWSANDIAFGGFDQMRGVVPQRQANAIPGLGQGSVVRAYLDSGWTIFEGRLNAVPRYRDGMAEIAGQGYLHDAARRTTRRLFQSADYSKWVTSESDPHVNDNGAPVYDSTKKIATEQAEGRLKWKLHESSITAASDARSGFLFYADDNEITRIAFTQFGSDANNDLEMQVTYADGPTGTMSVETQYALTTGNLESYKGVGGSGNGVKDRTMTNSTYDLVGLFLRCKTTTTPSNAESYWVTKLKVNGLASGDTFYAHEVFESIAGSLGWDADEALESSALNVLPLDWTDGSWADLLTYVADLEDRRWAVRDDRGAGPYVEYGPWERTWTVYQTAGASVELTPLPIYSHVKINYRTPAGVEQSVTVEADPNPLASRGIENVYEDTLEDRQADSTLATSVATTLAARYSTQRFTGTIQVSAAFDDSGRNAPYEMRGGDLVRIADWGRNEDTLLRVMDVSYGPNEVTLGIEQPVASSTLLASMLPGVGSSRKKPKKGKK